MKKYCERILKLRESKGLTQAELAKKLSELSTDGKSVSREMVNLWEKGSRDLKTSQIIIICKFFNVTADYLLGLSDCMSVESDVQAACKVTGLSEKAIENIMCSYMKFPIDFQNHLLQCCNASGKGKQETQDLLDFFREIDVENKEIVNRFFESNYFCEAMNHIQESCKNFKRANDFEEIKKFQLENQTEHNEAWQEELFCKYREKCNALNAYRAFLMEAYDKIKEFVENICQEDFRHDETNSQPE